MAKREEFVLTLEQCQRILQTCIAGRGNFPKKWGEKDIPIDEQLIAREDLGALFTTLRSYSIWMQGLGDDYQAVFGDKADWYPIDRTGKKIEGVSESDERIADWRFIDPNKKYKLRLGREALSGVVWCCILRLHLHPIIPTSTKEAVDIWWPIADAVGKSTAIRKYIGISAAKRTDWEEDPDPEEVKSV